MSENRYDRRDIIRREAATIAGPLKLAAYRVRDPETDEFSKLQFHMTFNNCIIAIMSEGEAELFNRFVSQCLANGAAPLSEVGGRHG